MLFRYPKLFKITMIQYILTIKILTSMARFAYIKFFILLNIKNIFCLRNGIMMNLKCKK